MSVPESAGPEVLQKADRVREQLAGAGRVLVAYSGGVDSTVLAALAHDVLGDRMLAVTADSETLYPGEADDARAIARERGWRHLIMRRSELSDPAFAQNPGDRCFYCKDDLYRTLSDLAAARGLDAVADGTNASDLRGHRPGFVAVKRNGILSPLVDAGMTKEDVRAVARGLGLPNAEKPALACLSSRFPQGQLITLAGLDRVAQAEVAVRRALRVGQVRVRDRGGVASIEVPPDLVVAAGVRRPELTRALLGLGFIDVLIDPAGYRPGSLARG